MGESSLHLFGPFLPRRLGVEGPEESGFSQVGLGLLPRAAGRPSANAQQAPAFRPLDPRQRAGRITQEEGICVIRPRMPKAGVPGWGKRGGDRRFETRQVFGRPSVPGVEKSGPDLCPEELRWEIRSFREGQPSSPARGANMTTSFVIIVHFGLGIREKRPPSGRAVFFWR